MVITEVEEVMSLRALWTSKKLHGNINFWKLFHKLLDDNIEWRIVRILAYWYSSQQCTIRWHNVYSCYFRIGNGKKVMMKTLRRWEQV